MENDERYDTVANGYEEGQGAPIDHRSPDKQGKVHQQIDNMDNTPSLKVKDELKISVQCDPVNNLISREDDFENWSSDSVCSEDVSQQNGSTVSRVPEVNICELENRSYENIAKDDVTDVTSSTNYLTVRSASSKFDLKGRLSSGFHESYESSAESRRSYMSFSGAPWPLAEGRLSPSFSSQSNSLSFDNAVHSNSRHVLESADLLNTPANAKDPFTNTTTSANGHTSTTPTTAEATDKDGGESKEEKKLSFKTLTRSQLILLIATSSSNLLSFLSLSILAPFFPIEAEKKNVSNTISGWIFGAFALTQFLTSPLFGRLLPIVGSRFMYIAGLFICGGCTFLFGILDKVDTTDDIAVFVSLCFVTRVLLALGCTALSNAGFVMLVKTFPDSVGTVFGIGEISTGVGMVTGPALGGFLYSAGGYIMPFAVIGGCCFFALPFVWWFLPKQDDSTTPDDGELSLRALLLHPRSLVNSLVIIVAASVWAVLDPTLEPHLRVYGLGPELVGVLFLIMAAFYSVTSPVWGRLADYLPDNRTLLIPGLLLAALGLLLSGPSPLLGFALSFNELWLMIVSLIILGVASSMCVIPTYDIYIDVLDQLGYTTGTRSYGMVSGLWVSMYALGDFAGPSLGGFVFEIAGFEWLVTGVGGICVFTAIVVAVTWFIEKKCCRKSTLDYVTEKTPLLSTLPNGTANNLDPLTSYPPKPRSLSESYI